MHQRYTNKLISVVFIKKISDYTLYSEFDVFYEWNLFNILSVIN